MIHFTKHCGNFSPDLLDGLIGYGREIDRGRGKLNSNEEPLGGDGYASKEADIILGGFIRTKAAVRAVHEGGHLYQMDTRQKERLALQIAREHLEKFGTVGTENYRHWLTRTRTYAKRKGIQLPPQTRAETNHQYFRRVRQWVKGGDETHPSPGGSAHNWPELRPAAGTHLVLSPDPQIWTLFRTRGEDERTILRCLLSSTMKDFADWRRKQHGYGRSLGWIAGTHVEANGADRHPHIHLVVLKRDEAGKEVDWSVSTLKGCKGRDDPDPMAEFKRLFSKNVEKEVERSRFKGIQPSRSTTIREPLSEQEVQNARRFVQGLRRFVQMTQPPRGVPQYGLGSTLRLVGMATRRIQQARKDHLQRHKPVDPKELIKEIQKILPSFNRTPKPQQEMER